MSSIHTFLTCFENSLLRDDYYLFASSMTPRYLDIETQCMAFHSVRLSACRSTGKTNSKGETILIPNLDQIREGRGNGNMNY